MQEPPTVPYQDVISPDNHGLYKWLSKIVYLLSIELNLVADSGLVIKDKFGFCFVSGVPETPEATEELCTRIGFIRETHCTLIHSLKLLHSTDALLRW